MCGHYQKQLPAALALAQDIIDSYVIKQYMHCLGLWRWGVSHIFSLWVLILEVSYYIESSGMTQNLIITLLYKCHMCSLTHNFAVRHLLSASSTVTFDMLNSCKIWYYPLLKRWHSLELQVYQSPYCIVWYHQVPGQHFMLLLPIAVRLLQENDIV